MAIPSVPNPPCNFLLTLAINRVIFLFRVFEEILRVAMTRLLER